MKKIITTSMILASCAVNAGTMGPVAVAPTQLFVSAEGGYTWNQINGTVANFGAMGTLRTKQSTNGGTGRLAVGVLRPVYDSFYMSAEFGGGYYGTVDQTIRASGALAQQVNASVLTNAFNAKTRIYGYDILVGAMYNQPAYDLFFKAGTLIQNAHVTANLNGSMSSVTVMPFAPITAALTSANINASAGFNKTEALPEIKLGGSYHVYENLALTASWSHVFGTSAKNRISYDPSARTAPLVADFTFRNPTLDVAMLGLEYRFA